MKPENLIAEAETSVAVAVHKFVLIPNKNSEKLYCFFEGKDTHYYTLRINTYTKREYEPIICGNKQQVLNTFKYFNDSGNYKNYLRAYFVDRDFDDLINIDEIYETPSYSIENLYVNHKTIKEVLKGEFFLTTEDDDFKKAFQVFNKNIDDFNSSTLLFNGWYYSLKVKKKAGNLNSVNVSLGEKLPKDFVNLSINSISSKYDLDKIRTTFKDAITTTDDEIQVCVEDLLKGDLCFRLRGKYQIIFLKKILNFFITDSNNHNVIFKSKTKFSLNETNIMSQLSQYAVTPDCLVDYLRKFN